MIEFKATSLPQSNGKWFSRGEIIELNKGVWWTLENTEEEFNSEEEANNEFYNFCIKQGWKKSK